MLGKNYEKEIIVVGMHCNNCAKHVEEALKKIKGVKKVLVELESGKVKILSKTEIDDTQINNTIDTLGYSVKN